MLDGQPTSKSITEAVKDQPFCQIDRILFDLTSKHFGLCKAINFIKSMYAPSFTGRV